MQLVLASHSRIRRQMLEGLGIQFDVLPSEFDEEKVRGKIAGLGPENQAVFLAEQKALEVSIRLPEAVVIGCDQICQLEGEILHKPKTRERAIAQLMKNARQNP